MHQLHFTINTYCEKDDSHHEIISNIESAVESHFSETSYWDWFQVIGYVNLKENKIHWNGNKNEHRFTNIIEKPKVFKSYSEYLASLITENILNVEQPKYSNDRIYYQNMKEFVNFINDLKWFDGDLVSGEVNNPIFNFEKLPKKIESYKDFRGYKLNKLGLTDFDDACDDHEDVILGLVDIHF